jgi:hypothetical protein
MRDNSHGSHDSGIVYFILSVAGLLEMSKPFLLSHNKIFYKGASNENYYQNTGTGRTDYWYRSTL